MNSYSERVLYDRYSVKDPEAELKPGDIVVVTQEEEDPYTGKRRDSRKVGIVRSGNGLGTFDVALKHSAETDNDRQVLSEVPRHLLEYVVERDYEPVCVRMSEGVIAEEPNNEEFKKAVYEATSKMEFIPAGRILAGLGRDKSFDLTLFNCYVFAIPGDSREAIGSHWLRLLNTYATGGGIGWNLSVLRPRGSIVKKVNGRSSGAVSWGEQFSQVTGAVEQGGCFGASTLISTTEGLIRADDLTDRLDQGDVVYAQTHKGPSQITAAFRNGEKKLYRVNTSKGYTVDVSADHKMGVLIEGCVKTKALRELKEGDETLLLVSERWREDGQKQSYDSPYLHPVKYDRSVMSTNLNPDEIVTIEPLGEEEVYDFEVADVHMLSGNGFYTSNSRRGAGLQGMWCWHPDIEEFIETKSLYEKGKTRDGKWVDIQGKLLTNSNVSVLISDDFMEAVEYNSDWDLVFPDTSHPDYDETWDGDLWKWRREGKPVEVYRTVNARQLWDKIVHHAWQSGEPGLLFMERFNKMSNSYYYDRLSCTNPCGEIGLSANGVCNLSHLNLAKFIHPNAPQFPDKERTSIDAWELVNKNRLREVIHLGIRFLDNCTELNKYHDEAVQKQQKKERRIGLGVLGFGEMLMRLGLGYGSHQGLKFTESLFRFISTESYLASVELAKEKGAFPAFEADKFVHSGFMRKHLPEVIEAVKEYGIRNVTLNTVAPTGSVSILADTTTGIEPYFALKWTATTRIGTAKEKMSVLEAIVDKFGENEENWPSYVVTVQQGISPAQHVKTQATAQRWIDSSLSKTVNLPKGAAVEDVSNAYIAMWRQGCKGGTVYVDESRDEQVLHVEEKEAKKKKRRATIEVLNLVTTENTLRPPLKSGIGPTFSIKTPAGSTHVTFRCDPETGEPYDFFINAGKGELAANAQAIARLISMILRWPDNEDVHQLGRLDMIREQLHKIPGQTQEGFAQEKVVSFPDAVAQAMNKFLQGDYPLSKIPMGNSHIQELLDDLAEYEVPPEILKKWSFSSTVVKEEEEEEEPKDEFEQAAIDFAEVEDTERYHKDICMRCNNVGWVQIPGKCSHCVLCGYKEC